MQLLCPFSYIYIYIFIGIFVDGYIFFKVAENSSSELHLEDKTKLVNLMKAIALVISNVLLSILQPEKPDCNQGTLPSQPSAK